MSSTIILCLILTLFQLEASNNHMDNDIEQREQNLSSKSSSKQATITLQQAIEFGEYNPQFLSNFAEWHTLTTHIQWQLVRKALDIRHKQLITQYAELNNVLDFSKKPHIHEALKNVSRQIADLMQDKENLYVEFSNKM